MHQGMLRFECDLLGGNADVPKPAKLLPCDLGPASGLLQPLQGSLVLGSLHNCPAARRILLHNRPQFPANTSI